ncbi:MAG: autotransporter outer membrane beta-barrel domain-containing protein, partial [Gammaproteobacteria bacterium]|nr:autotransporter outer membrane beta-barrel domain-containing protein [Gammaproteobacteria bacterium]
SENIDMETQTANSVVAAADSATVTITDNDNISIRIGGPRNINEERTFRFPVSLNATPTEDLTLNWAVTAASTAVGGGALSAMCDDPASDIVAASAGDFADSADGMASASFPSGTVTIAVGERAGSFDLHTSDGGGEDTCRRVFTLTFSMVMGGGGAAPTLSEMSVGVTITEDDPAARARVVATPLVRVAQGVGQLATAAIGERISFVGGNVLSVAGRQVSALSETQKAAASGAWAASPFERARVLAASSGGGSGVTAKELLEQSSFALSLGGSGLNLWGSGGRMSAKGDDNNVSYDGDSTAWHFGADTPWRDGLLGVAVSQTSSETDFTPAGEAQQKLDTDVTSVHPYMSRNLSDKTRLWAAFGYGVGDADLVEEGVTLKSDLTVLGLGAGLTMNPVEGIQLRLGGQWSRAELDGANSGGKELRAVNASALRLNVGMEAGIEVGAARPFVTLRIRHDSGDGDEGSAADYGAGVEWQRDAMHVRVEGSGHLQGDAADEESLSITVRRQAAANAAGLAPYARWNLSAAAAGAKMRMHNGRLSLGMEVGVDDNTMRLGNLFTGEWRF